LQPKSASATCSSSGDGMYHEAVSTPTELRGVRSPRSRSNPSSAQNSPQRVEVPTELGSPKPSISMTTGTGKICLKAVFTLNDVVFIGAVYS